MQGQLSGDSPVVILCGGRSTRMREGGEGVPKPLVEIGARPILWHVIQIYARQGFRRFLLCLGHRGDLIRSWAEAESWPAQLEIECADTGETTPTGGRVKLVADRVGQRAFCVTYADGLGDVDLERLVAFHRSHGDPATVTVVRPTLQYGIAELDGDGRVRDFREKPRSEHWVNGGFLCFEPQVLDYLDQSSVLEREPLERLAAEGKLRAFRHRGFWASMDTHKDALRLNELWAQGNRPWERSGGAASQPGDESG
jgi:glucose-1-phosphate cytidylyltransferase